MIQRLQITLNHMNSYATKYDQIMSQNLKFVLFFILCHGSMFYRYITITFKVKAYHGGFKNHKSGNR